MTDERPNRTESESLALAGFCLALPELRARAELGFWTDALEMHIGEVAGGGSALAACRELGLELRDEWDPRQGEQPGIDGARTEWLPAPSLVGDYRCPLRRCVRRAGRDDRGRPPRCAVSGEQMSFVRQDSA